MILAPACGWGGEGHGRAEQAVCEFDVPCGALDLDDVGHGHHQGGVGTLGAEGVDGHGQGDGQVAHDRAVDHGDGVAAGQDGLAKDGAQDEIYPVDDGQGEEDLAAAVPGAAHDGLGLEGQGDEDDAQHPEGGQGWEARPQAFGKGFLAVDLSPE